jgi:signal transduction histidine kinase
MALKSRLRRKTNSLQVASRKLKSEIVRRKGFQKALAKSERHYDVLLNQSRQMQEHLRHLTHRILTVQEEERREISRELHDEIGETLTGINVRLANLKREAALNPTGITAKIARTQLLVKRSVTIVHRFAQKLRPALLDDLGLVPALRSFINGMMERTQIPIKLIYFEELELLDVKKRTVFYRVAQEALTNVARHAKAKAVHVTFRKRRRSVAMEIRDDGMAFKVESVIFAKKSKHLGILGMRERVEMVGGTFKIESVPKRGTVISAEIPFKFADKK